MTRDDLMAEQFGPGTDGERNPEPLADWTPAEQVRHIADVLELTPDQAVTLLAVHRAKARQRAKELREAIIGDLPPDSRDHAVIVRAAGS